MTSVNVPLPLLRKSESPGAFQTSWTTLHRNRFVLAGLALAKLRQVVDVEIDVVGDEEIEIAVVIVIDERGAGGPHADR